MKDKKNPVAAGVFLLTAVLASCGVKQDVYISRSGSGRAGFEISVASYLSEVVAQVSLMLNAEEALPDEENPLFDLPAIEEDFRNRDGVDLLRLESPHRNRLEGEFTFTDVNLLLQDVKEGSAESRLIRWEERNGITEFRVLINRETIEEILAANPSLNNPLVENFGPAATEGFSERDYLDMMEFALGTESRQGIRESALNLTVRVEGQVLSMSGGTKLDDNTVRYRIPLLTLLVINKPLEYSLRYR